MVFKTNYRLLQVKSIAESRSILQYFRPSFKLPFGVKIFIFSIFEWLFYTGFTELPFIGCSMTVDTVPHGSRRDF